MDENKRKREKEAREIEKKEEIEGKIERKKARKKGK